jgi:RimJ/RimL family protein N-acetyltransferase
MNDLFRGDLVSLTAEEPEVRAKQGVRWQRDTEFHRLIDTAPADLFSEKHIRAWIEKGIEGGFKPERYFFSIRTLTDDQLVGFLNLWCDLIHREVWVGIGIGDRAHWGKGYGTDAMKLCLRYAFMELGAERVSLGLHEYNPRAQRAYEKVGFKMEGYTREDTRREGRWTGGYWMGILRDEWVARQGVQA